MTADHVDRLISAATATADRDLAHAVRPAFTDVVARAARLDPAAVPTRWLAAADDPRPAWPAEPAVAPRRRWLVPLLAAAAVLLAFGVQRGLARRDPASERAFQAGAQPDPAAPQSSRNTRPSARTTTDSAVHDSTTQHSVTRDGAALDSAARNSPAHDSAAHDSARNAAADDSAARNAAARDAAVPDTTRTADTSAADARAPHESLDDLLARLDDEAEACMQAGDLACADARYREIVQRGGRRVQVELAFADRFHLARQRGDDDALRKLWTAYLTRFPRGQFADDARGGSCRHAAQPAACWRSYLADFPTGSFAAEAAEAAR